MNTRDILLLMIGIFVGMIGIVIALGVAELRIIVEVLKQIGGIG